VKISGKRELNALVEGTRRYISGPASRGGGHRTGSHCGSHSPDMARTLLLGNKCSFLHCCCGLGGLNGWSCGTTTPLVGCVSQKSFVLSEWLLIAKSYLSKYCSPLLILHLPPFLYGNVFLVAAHKSKRELMVGW